MVNKTVWSLSIVCFALSTLLSLVGIISVIQIYFNVSIYFASLYASVFAGTLGFSSLITPALFSRFEKKRLMIFVIIITIICCMLEIFISNYYIGLVLRIIPAIVYPIGVSSALTIVGKIHPEQTNRVVLGVSSGSILGLSITSYLGFVYGYQTTMLWFSVINVIALILTVLFIPNFEGNKEPVSMQISYAKSKLFLLSLTFLFFVIIGISITYNYIPTYLSQVTKVDSQFLFVILFAMGLMSMVGTILYGYLIQRNSNGSILFYPLGFALMMFLIGFFIKQPIYEFIALLIFGIFDGAANTVSQFWVTSSIREAPEFGNGIYLLMSNLSIFIGTMVGGAIIANINIYYIFYGSIIMMLLSLPFVILRIREYPDAR